MPGKIVVGTASWSDPGFVQDWYPPRLPAGDRLPFYARHFQMVEVNSSFFYSVPAPKVAMTWDRATPDGFVFDLKLHKLLSRHVCRREMLPPDLRAAALCTVRGSVIYTPELEEEMVDRILFSATPLERAGKLGFFLLQLSPSFSPRAHQLAELDSILSHIGPERMVVELRNRNWLTGTQREETVAHFAQQNVTLAAVDGPRSEHFTVMPSTDHRPTNERLAYLRLHGRNEHGYLHGKSVAERFDYDYSNDELEEVADRVDRLAEQTEVVHVIFNNNRSDYAPKAALRFRRIIGQAVPAEPALAKKEPQQTELGLEK